MYEQLNHLIDRLYSSVQRQRATEVMQHAPDERLTEIGVETQILGSDLRIEIKYDHPTLTQHAHTYIRSNSRFPRSPLSP